MWSRCGADGEIRTPGQRFTKMGFGVFEGFQGHALNSKRRRRLRPMPFGTLPYPLDVGMDVGTRPNGRACTGAWRPRRFSSSSSVRSIVVVDVPPCIRM